MRIISYACICLVLLLASCGSDSSVDWTAGNGLKISASLDAENSIDADNVSLSLVPVSESAEGSTYAIVADGLAATKAVYGRISYETQSAHVRNAEVADADSLSMIIDDGEGAVHFGWVQANYDRKGGINGELVIGNVNFAKGAGQPDRRVSVPPTGGGANNEFSIEGEIDGEGIPTLTWPDTNDGDGSNDGLVSLADLTPLAQQFGNSVSEQSAGVTVVTKADYNHDGLVAISDLTPLGGNFNNQLSGYVVQSGPAEDNLSDLETIQRSAEFSSPNTGDGVLTWEWMGAAITEDTYYQVIPIDGEGARGRASSNVVMLEAPILTEQITELNPIVFTGSEAWPQDGDSNYQVLITELSVDEINGNNEPFAPEMFNLTVTGRTDQMPDTDQDLTEEVIWFLEEGGGLANISNQPSQKGLLTFMDRGFVTITIQAPGDPLLRESISFALLSIESLELSHSGGSTGDAIVAIGDNLQFAVEGTFDVDNNDANGNELTEDLSAFCNWSIQPSFGSAADYLLDTFNAVLQTGAGSDGDVIGIACEFPRTDNVTLYDNLKRSSNFIDVSVLQP